MLDLWEIVREVPSTGRSDFTGTFILVGRLRERTTDKDIENLPGWLVCSNPRQEYLLFYFGRRA